MSTTLNMSYQSNPESVAQGGTGVATNTAYGMLAAGTSSANPVQQIGAGTAGYLYPSGGNAALGAPVAAKSSTCMQLIGTQAASNSASITFSSLSSTYFAYKLIIDAAVPVSGAVNLRMQLGGVASNYQYGLFNITTGGTASNPASTSATGMLLTSATGLSNTASVANNWEITLIAPTANVGNYPIMVVGRYGTTLVWGSGWYCLNNASLTSILVQASSGNISTGTFKLYGILA